MIVVRHTNQARYGMGDALVKLTGEMLQLLGRDQRVTAIRILTDVSGPAFTVEAEYEVASLAAFEEVQAELTQGVEFAGWFARIQPLVDHGRRDFFTVRS